MRPRKNAARAPHHASSQSWTARPGLIQQARNRSICLGLPPEGWYSVFTSLKREGNCFGYGPCRLPTSLAQIEPGGLSVQQRGPTCGRMPVFQTR